MALRRNLLAAGAPRTAVAGFVAAPPAVASQPSLASPTRTHHGAHTKQVDASCAVMAIRPGTVTRRIEEADRNTR